MSPNANIRATQRVQLEVVVTLESDHNFYTGLTCDVSEGGIFVATYAPPAPGSVVELDLKLEENGGAHHLMGVVRWTREVRASSDGCPPGCGIEWVDIPPQALVAIHKFVESRDTLFYDAA